MKCVIPCAGESSRMLHVPKYLISLNGIPLLEHIVRSWESVVDNFVFVMRRNQSYLLEHIPENSIVVFQDRPKGLADAILRAEPCISEDFVINLGDCVFLGKFQRESSQLGVGVWSTTDLEEVNKSYLVTEQEGTIKTVWEKPGFDSTPPEILPMNCGLGIYFMDPRLFSYLRRFKPKAPGGGDFTEVLQMMIDGGEELAPIWFKGQYVNVTQPSDIDKAEKAFSRRG